MSNNLSSKSDLVIVFTTESNKIKAEELSKSILQDKLAACVSLKEVDSHYWWDGKLQHQKEVQLLIKTSSFKQKKLVSAIKKLSSYENPEVIFGFFSASDSYRQWIDEVTSS